MQPRQKQRELLVLDTKNWKNKGTLCLWKIWRFCRWCRKPGGLPILCTSRAQYGNGHDRDGQGDIRDQVNTKTMKLTIVEPLGYSCRNAYPFRMSIAYKYIWAQTLWVDIQHPRWSLVNFLRNTHARHLIPRRVKIIAET